MVVLSQVLACEATLGYEDYCNIQVLKFNGTPVRNLRHLTELVSDCKEKYMRFDLAYRVSIPCWSIVCFFALGCTTDVLLCTDLVLCVCCENHTCKQCIASNGLFLLCRKWLL